jgi:hypothetical protein
MLLAVALLMRYVLPPLLRRIAHSSELLMLFAIASAILGGAAGDALGFSKEVGAFLAGVAIASTPYRDQVAARMVSLRDFLLLFFFIELGSTLDLSTLGSQLGAAVLLSVFVLVGNPLIVMAIMGYMGYRRRTGFLAGLTVAQISEFSLILAALGLSLGHLQAETVGLITLVGLITISASTYMILYSHLLYERLGPWLGIFERRIPYREPEGPADENDELDVLLVGLGRYGAALASKLRESGCRLLVLDSNPDTVQRHAEDGFLVHYGDAEDPEFSAALPLSQVRWVVSAIRDPGVNRVLINSLRSQGYQGRIAIATSRHPTGPELDSTGVDMILTPYADAARDAANRITSALAGPTRGGQE